MRTPIHVHCSHSCTRFPTHARSFCIQACAEARARRDAAAGAPPSIVAMAFRPASYFVGGAQPPPPRGAGGGPGAEGGADQEAGLPPLCHADVHAPPPQHPLAGAGGPYPGNIPTAPPSSGAAAVAAPQPAPGGTVVGYPTSAM